MTELCLVVRIAASKRRDAERLAGVISDYADEQFEAYTTDHGRPMTLVSYIEEAKEHEKLYMALAQIIEWYDDLPNDTFDGMPLAIKRARRLIPEREK
jgi:hypothetical protein